MTTVNIMDYNTGEGLGEATVDMDRYNQVAQWPEGLVDARDILTIEDMDRLNIQDNQVIYVEE